VLALAEEVHPDFLDPKLHVYDRLAGICVRNIGQLSTHYLPIVARGAVHHREFCLFSLSPFCTRQGSSCCRISIKIPPKLELDHRLVLTSVCRI
jgi:hypothetical protein